MRALPARAALVVVAAFALLSGASLAVAEGANSVGVGFAQVTSSRATSFHPSYVLGKDGSVEVTEDIWWSFPTDRDNHGIYRTVTVRAGIEGTDTSYRYYQLTDVAVTSSTGAPTDLEMTDQGSVMRLRIGSPSQLVNGRQHYVVTYRLAHVVNDIGDGTAEFYYNVSDDSTETTMQGIRVSVTGPAAPTRLACFYGPQGSTTPCQGVLGSPATFTVPDLEPAEGASVLLSYPRTAFTDLTNDIRQGDAGSTAGSSVSPATAHRLGLLTAGAGLFAPLLALAGMGLLVWRRGRDEQYVGVTPGLAPGIGQESRVIRSARRPTVAVQFTPPPGVQPGMLGTVLDEEANLVDVTATLIDLAVRGHLTLTKHDGAFGQDDWLLTRQTPPAGAAPLVPYEQALLDGVFVWGESVLLSELKNKFAGTLSSTRTLMYDEVVQRGWFRRSPERQRQGWMGLGVLLMGASVVWVFFLRGFTSGLYADSGLPVSPSLVLGAGGFVAGLVVLLLGRRMAARTADGSAVLAQSLGFKQYLVTAEANQIKFEEASDLFSRYLPFAIVFGVADRWARTFDEVAAAAQAAGTPIFMPTWYVGSWNGGFGGIAASTDSFSTVAAGTFVATPGSSGSSGFSTGGGFSGGGGGGSGGGSW